MTRFTITVPVRFPDGDRIPRKLFRQVEAALVRAAGGFTRTYGAGGWRDPDGRTVTEPVAVYAADAPASEHSAIHSIAETVRLAADQQAVYLTEQPVTVEQHSAAHSPAES